MIGSQGLGEPIEQETGCEVMEDEHEPKYERGEGRYKHRWNKDQADFCPGAKGAVGKCHNSITEKVAEDLLRGGFPYCENNDDQSPSKIYAVYKGAIYEAVPTVPGKSWHGYPWRGDLKGRSPLPRRIKRNLKEQAEQAGYLEEFERWLKKYS